MLAFWRFSNGDWRTGCLPGGCRRYLQIGVAVLPAKASYELRPLFLVSFA